MNRREFRIGPGAASLMLIVVVLSMSVLGMLALMNARSDVRLGERSIAVAQDIYQMNDAAQASLAALDALLAANAGDAADDAEYLARVARGLPAGMTMEGDTVSWSEQGENRMLLLSAKIAPKGAFPRCRLTRHTLRTALDDIDGMAGMEFEEEWN